MRGKRLIAAFSAAVLLIFATAGCASTNQADTDAVTAALDKFHACTEFTVIQTTEGQESVVIDQVEYIYSGTTEKEISLITEPEVKIKTTTRATLDYAGEKMEQSALSYIFAENGGYTEYYYDGAAWYTLSTEDDSALAGVEAEAMTYTFFADKIGFKKAGESTLESGKAIHYKGSLGGEDLVSMLQLNGLLSSISSMSENQQTKIKQNLAKDLDDVTVSVWIDEASGYPVRFEVSLTEILRDMENSINKTLGEKSSSQWLVTGYVISMTVKDFDAVEDIVLPPESASAQPYDYEQDAASGI